MQTEIEIVQKEVLTIPQQARMIVVKDQGSLENANRFFIVIRALKKKIAATFDPMEAAAKEAKRKAEESRKTIMEERAKIEAPLNVAEDYLSGQVVGYKREQDRIREEEQEKLRQEAIRIEAGRRKKEEDERVAQAAILEESGATEEAEALVNEAIEEKEKPIEVYIPPPETPKVKLEGASIKTYWSAKVVNLQKLVKAVAENKAPLTCLEANMTTLNGLARSLKKEMKIDGVEVVQTSSMGATGR